MCGKILMTALSLYFSFKVRILFLSNFLGVKISKKMSIKQLKKSDLSLISRLDTTLDISAVVFKFSRRLKT